MTAVFGIKHGTRFISAVFLLSAAIALFFFVRGTFTRPAVSNGGPIIILATTCSVFDTGMLDYPLKDFSAKTGIKVKTIVAGSGESLKMGERGECDIILAHSPALEEKFMAAGFGKERKSFARNEFYIVGPERDPAGIKGAKNAFEAFARLDGSWAFISRGDNSGTHNREISIWEKASGGGKKASALYSVTGQGMAETLMVADNKQAYTLCDSATFTFMERKLKIKKLFDDKKNLSNVYSIITVNPEKSNHVRYEPAKELYDFLLSPKTLKFIFEFGKDKFAKPLFEPLEDT